MIPDYEGPNAPAPIQHEPGIYFSMPSVEYHADPALGSSSLKALNISPITYWRDSHMNKDREADETDATELGDAFHARLLEGPEAFAERFAASLDEEDHPEALKGAKMLAERCVSLGLPKSGTIAELEARILAKEPGALLWTRLLSDHGKANHGRTLLKPAIMAKVEATAAHVSRHPDASAALSGGYPEVSLFWEDPETGVRCKMRLDRLKERVAIDLKSFSNTREQSIDRAIASAMAGRSYLTQAVHYSQGLEEIKALCMKGDPSDLVIAGITGAGARWLDDVVRAPPHRFVFVFVESCQFPAIRVRECSRRDANGEETLYWKSGRDNVRRALETYAACMKAFGPDRPWVDVAPMSAFSDEEMFYAL